MKTQIQGGHFLLSRKIYLSAIWKKQPSYLRLWLWLMGKANYEEGHVFKGHTLKRGELIVTYDKIAEALSFTANRRIIKPSIKEIRVMLNWLKSEGMIFMKPVIDGTLPNKGRPIDRTGAYVGLSIYIINYDTYQDSESYKGRDKGRPTDEQGQTYNKEVLKRKKNPCNFFSEISELKKRYSDQEIIDQAFEAISSTRKSNRIAESVKLSILKSWERFPAELVMAGIRTYLSKGYHDQGKDESYLTGIIRNSNGNSQSAMTATTGKVLKNTGSAVLNEHYRSQGYRIV